jgi:hypothetical protein
VIEKADRGDLLVESFGQECPDHPDGWIPGREGPIEDRILIDLQREELWPPSEHASHYDLDALYDLVEFVYDHVSNPIGGRWHSYFNHTHWEEFEKRPAQDAFRRDVNRILSRADPPVELHEDGHIRLIPAEGFEQLVDAQLPESTPIAVAGRVRAAIAAYKNSRSPDDLRNAVRDLGDALEALRRDAKLLLSKKDERDLFEVLNKFAIRHLDDKQRADYDAPPYHRWMFYVLLATVHLVLRLRGEEST